MAAFGVGYGTQSQYDSATKNTDIVYFITDTKRIYKGSDLYGGDVIIVTTPPSGTVSPEHINRLIISNDSGDITMWYGDTTGYVEIEMGVSTIDADVTTVENLTTANFKSGVIQTAVRNIATATDTNLVTEKAVATSVGNCLNGVSYTKSTGDWVFTRVDGASVTINMPLEHLIADIEYNSATHELEVTLESGSTATISLADLVDVYTGGTTNTSTVAVTAGSITTNVRVSATAGNALSAETDGLFVATPTGSSTNSATVSVTSGVISADVKISTTSGNTITVDSNGLFVPAGALEWIQLT